MKVINRVRLSILIVLLFLAGVGCNKRSALPSAPGMKAMPVPRATAEKGWPLYEVPAEQFALTLPPDWIHLEVNPLTVDDMLKKMVANNPEMVGVGDTIRQQVKAGVKFLGFEKQAIGKRFATNVSVIKLALPPGATLDAVADSSIQQIRTLCKPTGAIDRERKTTPHLEAERIRFNPQMAGPDGRQLSLTTFQHYYVTEKDYFVLTFTTTANRADQDADVANSIGDSFRVLKKK